MQETALSHSPDTDLNQAPGYSPSEAEEKDVKLVERLFLEGKRSKEPYDTKWASNYKFFKGKQWPDRRPSYRHSEVLNFIFSEVQTVLVLLTDARPNIEIIPEEPSDLEFAEILSQIVKSKWESQDWSATLAEAILDASIYGTAIACVPWKPELAGGLGDFTFETKDIFHIFPDPNAKTKINDEYCDWVVEAEPVDVKKLKAKYPDKADFISADITDVSAAYQDKEGSDEVRYKSPTDNRVAIESDRSIRGSRPNQVLQLCAYVKSDELIEEETKGEIDPETNLPGPSTFQTKKKWPNGRKIVVANGVLLEGGENPYIEGRFPYARLVDHAMPREFWGIGEVEQLKSPQMIVNKLISYILDVLTSMGNPIWIVDNDSGIDTENLTNQPGLVVEKNKGTEAKRQEGVQLQPYVMQVLEFMSERVLQKLGSTADVSKGAAPADASGYAIAQLKESANTKIRGKSKNVESFLKEVGSLAVDRILQMYTVPRVVRVTNNENAASYFKFAIDETVAESGEVSQFATVQQYMQDPLSGQWALAPAKQFPVKSKMDIRFNVGSSLPFAKMENRLVSKELYTMGIIDAEEYLTQIEYPNKEKIIERMKQRMAQMPPAGMPGDPNGTAPSPAPAVA